MPYPNEHAARLIDPDRFDPDTFRRENNQFGDGVDAIFGKLKGENTMTLQAIHFDAGKFTAEDAREWLNAHDYEPINFEESAEAQVQKGLAYFIPLKKADETRREVWGVAAMEQPDQGGEIMDYEKSKPYFQAWSRRVQKASGGKSWGNVRDSHTLKAVGKVIRLAFDDVAKAVRVGVKILDGEAWQKVTEGVFTGFSVGGGYGDRWPDPLNKSLFRYVAIPSEISLVDLPCIPGATFEMVKANGVKANIRLLSKGDAMKDKIKTILKKQLGDLSEEELSTLAEEVAEEVAAALDEEIPAETLSEDEDEASAESDSTSESEEAADEQPEALTANDVKEIVLSLLQELGLIEKIGGEMQMGAKIRGLSKRFSQVDAIQKSFNELKTQLVKDIAALAVEVEALGKRGGMGPVLLEMGTLTPNGGAALQKAETLKAALKSTTDPMTRQALQNEIARLEIQSVHQSNS